MKCPMSAANPYVFDHGLMECDPECALFVKVKGDDMVGDNTFACGLASIATRTQGKLVFAAWNFAQFVNEDYDVIEG